MTTPKKRFLLIVNGKSAGNAALREAVAEQRKAGMSISVRVTWEAGDAGHFAVVAVDMGMTHVIACGGDGTVNEVMNGLMRLDKERRPVMGIVPLGSANDFATSVGLPLEPSEGLSAALTLSDYPIDVVKLCAESDTESVTSYYVNMMTAGFGAEITSSTPKMLKRMLGGGAYSLMGAVKAWRHHSYRGTLHWDDQEESTSLLLLAIGNGRQSGGGQVLAPKAKLDDGHLDILVVKDFLTARALTDLVSELQDFPSHGQFVRYVSADALSVSTLSDDPPWPLTLDGEARHYRRFRADVVPLAIHVVLPDQCPLLSSVIET
ncbi:lipid kinase YegS [Halomonas sp. A40-4]|uniref:lipid kinase YegS n=1 Tax=Halomonas sp. A40-4 TaxID=2785909 RepID=UPI0018F02358|nr:lipid kinase YegS [Halomonas sp. A40-4]QPL44785.1 lipid kinase YegS [Halomonas sp. A40-4]